MIFLSLYLSSLLTHNPPWCRTTVRACEIVFPRATAVYIPSLNCFILIFFSFISLLVWCFPLFYVLLVSGCCCVWASSACTHISHDYRFTDAHPGTKVWFERASDAQCEICMVDSKVLVRLHRCEEQIMTELALDLNRCCKWRCSNHVSVVLLTTRVSDKPVWTSSK